MSWSLSCKFKTCTQGDRLLIETGRLDHQVVKIDLGTLGESEWEEDLWMAAIRHFFARLYHFVEFLVL